MKKLRHSRSGFTLMELMIVIAIVGILMGISVLPYGEYMDRARLSNNVDAISQEWILAHKEVRNGKIFPDGDTDATNDSHATIIFEFDEENQKMKKFLYKTKKEPVDETRLADIDYNALDFVNPNGSDLRLDKEIPLERNVKLYGTEFSNPNETIYYAILPPYGEGKFNDGTSQKTIKIGLPTNDENSTKIKNILLRSYLQ